MTKEAFNREFHKRILLQLLIGIFKKFYEKLGFKGGTCAYLFYNLPRISIDLDFDILRTLSSEEIDELKIIIERYGKIRDFYEKYFTIFFLLDYKPYAPNIKIELNKRLWKNNNYRSVWLFGVEIKIADESTIFTNKLVALTNREQVVARDLFDIYYFLKMGYSINTNLLKERTGKNFAEYLKLLESYIIEKFTKRNILHGLGELLEEKQKDWARDNLIKEIIDEIKKLRVKEKV